MTQINWIWKLVVVIACGLLGSWLPEMRCDSTNGFLSLPNMGDRSRERPFGFGVVFPYPYFQRPRYRFPVYDRNGRGQVYYYGFGGRDIYPYKTFTPSEGHHKR